MDLFPPTALLLNAEFTDEDYSVFESDGSIPVCVTLTGPIDRGVELEIATLGAGALGKINAILSILMCQLMVTV